MLVISNSVQIKTTSAKPFENFDSLGVLTNYDINWHFYNNFITNQFPNQLQNKSKRGHTFTKNTFFFLIASALPYLAL